MICVIVVDYILMDLIDYMLETVGRSMYKKSPQCKPSPAIILTGSFEKPKKELLSGYFILYHAYSLIDVILLLG